ncbi:hypothetical protein C1646_769368 [Rhizophagus diaphanus]|nr:hypothetical protein C1646_769368 [Rhizophagus diaphanus] [Rhizophagus sp. MUCL 43196]
MEIHWKLKEEYYFGNTTPKKYQIRTELGVIDIEDKNKIERLKKLKECGQYIGHILNDNDESDSSFEQTTNKKSQMQIDDENRKFQNLRNQSITMASTADYNMGENSIKGRSDRSANHRILNNEKLLEYHMNTLGWMNKNGNEYTYIGFFTETAKNNFIQDGRVLEEKWNIDE